MTASEGAFSNGSHITGLRLGGREANFDARNIVMTHLDLSLQKQRAKMTYLDYSGKKVVRRELSLKQLRDDGYKALEDLARIYEINPRHVEPQTGKTKY